MRIRLGGPKKALRVVAAGQVALRPGAHRFLYCNCNRLLSARGPTTLDAKLRELTFATPCMEAHSAGQTVLSLQLRQWPDQWHQDPIQLRFHHLFPHL